MVGFLEGAKSYCNQCTVTRNKVAPETEWCPLKNSKRRKFQQKKDISRSEITWNKFCHSLLTPYLLRKCSRGTYIKSTAVPGNSSNSLSLTDPPKLKQKVNHLHVSSNLMQANCLICNERFQLSLNKFVFTYFKQNLKLLFINSRSRKTHFPILTSVKRKKAKRKREGQIICLTDQQHACV